jgi:anti-sigma factor RsiW
MTMNVNCRDRDRIFEDGTPAEWLALEAHAASCPACEEEIRAWKSLSMAAKEMRDYSDSPSFWPRIERALGVAKYATRRAQGLVLVSAEFFACVANSPGWRFRSGSDHFRGLVVPAPA